MRGIRFVLTGALLATAAFVSSGPPWISVQYPANPYDAASRGAFLMVHAFHHGTPVSFPVSGTAEGLVKGERRTISLEFNNTSKPGVYALRKQWPAEGVWTLVLAVTQGSGEGSLAQALVELAPDGSVARVDVPTRRRGDWLVPAPVSIASVETALRARAVRLASR